MRVLVTGGAGFIGSHVAEYFASIGSEVVILDNFARDKLLGKDSEWTRYNINYLKSKFSDLILVEADIRDFNEVLKAASGCDLIVHAAAQVAVTTSLIDPMTDFTINAQGTLNVLEAARRYDSAVIFLSTNKVYGDRVNQIPVVDLGTRYYYNSADYRYGIPEEFPVDGCAHTPYGCSKLAADIYVQDYGRVYGLRTIVFRMSCIYGERQFGVEDQGWLAHFIRRTISGEPITIYGDGKQVRDVLHVEDLVKAIAAAYNKASNLIGVVLNIGGGPENTISLLEAIDYIASLHGSRPVLRFEQWRQADQKVYVSDIRKAKNVLGWSPQIGWREGIKRLYKWISRVLCR